MHEQHASFLLRAPSEMTDRASVSKPKAFEWWMLSMFALGISYSAFVSLLIPPFVTETSPIGWVSVGLWRRQITKGQLPVPSILLSSDEGDAP